MSDQLRLVLGESRPLDHGAPFSEKREALGLSIDDVADRLLLSRNQVRGLESDSAAAFYSRRFFERARDCYATLLNGSSLKPRRTETARVTLTMTFASARAPDVPAHTNGRSR